ncbi:MAG: WGxxGxxG family protein [Leptolyngbyaceae cyanobacterium bins.349]|nr:WGxxGxxG family protein [Leptolyngbyaceae cyanobacterium bins.349]
MKRFNQFVSTSLLAMGLSLTATVLPVAAQTNPAPGAAPTTENPQQNNAPNLDTTPFQETRGKADNYGWLGLFGLLGLLNLLRKPEQATAYREPDVATTSQTQDRY